MLLNLLLACAPEPVAFCQDGPRLRYKQGFEEGLTVWPDEHWAAEDSSSSTGLRLELDRDHPALADYPDNYADWFDFLSTLDGFGLTSGLFFRFDDPLDAAHLEDAFLVALTPEGPLEVPFDARLIDLDTTLLMEPRRALPSGTRVEVIDDEGERVDVGGRIESARDVAGQLDPLDREIPRRLAAWCRRGEALGRPGERGHAGGDRMPHRVDAGLRLLYDEPVEEVTAAAEAEIVHLHEVGAVGGEHDVEHAAAPFHGQVAAVGRRQDDHRLHPRVDAGCGAFHEQPASAPRLAPKQVDLLRPGHPVGDRADGDVGDRVPIGASALGKRAHGEDPRCRKAGGRQGRRLVGSDRHVGGDRDDERVGHGRAVGGLLRHGRDPRMGEPQRGRAGDVLARDRHVERRAGAASHRHCREQPGQRQADRLGRRGRHARREACEQREP